MNALTITGKVFDIVDSSYCYTGIRAIVPKEIWNREHKKILSMRSENTQYMYCIYEETCRACSTIKGIKKII